MLLGPESDEASEYGNEELCIDPVRRGILNTTVFQAKPVPCNSGPKPNWK